MLLNLLNFRLISALAFTIVSSLMYAQSPTTPARDFNVFTLGNATLQTNESEGPVAIGGDLTVNGSYQVAIHSGGTFLVNNVKIGLLVNGKVNYQGGNSLQVNSNSYVKIGNPVGSTVWYTDPNNATPPIRITPNSNYNSSPKIMLQANAPSLGVSAINNPVFQSNLLDFSAAFQTMSASSLSIAQCTSNVQLTNPNGQSIPTTNLPNQVKINMQNGINYWNISAADLNAVQVLTFNNKPSASRILVINVNATGTFNWNVWNQAGIGFAEAPFIMYNFHNTTQLNINNGATTVGTVFAPFADVFKGAGNQSNIQGQVIAKSFIHSGGEVHYAVFSPTVAGCAAPPVAGIAPTANFSTPNTTQCLGTNSFPFTNTSAAFQCSNAASMETFANVAAVESQFNGLYFSAEGRSGNNALNGTFEADIHHITPYTIKSQADFVWPNNQDVPFTIVYNPNAVGTDKFVYTLGTGLTQKIMKFDPTTENYPLDINAIWFYSRTAANTTLLVSDLVVENNTVAGTLGAQNPSNNTFTNVLFRNTNFDNGFTVTGKVKFGWTGAIPQNSSMNWNFKIGNVTCTPTTVSQPSAPLSYVWNFGDGTTSTLMSPTKVYATAGTYTVTLTTTNTFGVDVKTQQVIVNPTTNAVVNQSTSATGSGSITKQLVLTNSVAFANYSWAVSNGASGLFTNQSTVNFTFTQAGNYQVTLTSSNANGCQTTTVIPITITSGELNIAPTANFSTPNATQCLGTNSFTFTNTSTPTTTSQPSAPLSYVWNFGDGTTSTLMSPTKVYATAGTYTVTLTTTNTVGFDVKTQQVLVNPATNAVVNQSTSATSSSSITKQLVLTNSLDFTNYSWAVSNGASGLFANQSTVNFTFTQAGNYQATLTATNANGCQTTTVIPITITCVDLNAGHGQSPTTPARNFNVFTLGNSTLQTNESEGPVAIGGDLTVNGNYQVAIQSAGTFLVNNVKIGLLVNGKVNYQSGNSLQVNSNGYVKIGNPIGSTVWYADPNNATPPIRITPNSNYNSSPRIMLQANAPSLGVSVNNNPVFQSNLLDFSAAFQTMEASSLIISQFTSNVQLTDSNGQSIPSTNLPNQVKISMQDGINYWNISAADLNAVQVLTFNNKPSASKVLVINVNAAGTFNWNVWNQAGIGFAEAPFIMYNFHNTTQLNINNGATTVGTVFAPFADVFKGAGNQSNIQGQVIAKSFIHSGGEIHYAVFSSIVTGCAAAPVEGIAPTAHFSTPNASQCLGTNSFPFTNTSAAFECLNAPSIQTFTSVAAVESQFNGLYFSAEGRSGNNALNGTFEANIHHINPYTIKSQADFVWPNNQNVPFTIVYNPNAVGIDKFVYTLGTGLTQKIMNFDPTTENYPLDINAIWFYSRTAPNTTLLVSDLVIENSAIAGALGAQNPAIATFTNVLFRNINFDNGFTIAGKVKFGWTGAIPQQSSMNWNFKIGNVTCSPIPVSQPSAPLSYLWEFGDGTTSTSMNPTKVYAAAGSYTVKLTTTNTFGVDFKTQQVLINAATTAVVSQSTSATGATSITKQLVLTNSLNFANYSWTVSNGASGLFTNQSTVDFTFTQAGYYEVTLTATDANGCQTNTIIPIIIASADVSTGNAGAIESESLGDIMSRQYVSRKMKSIPTEFVKSQATRFDKKTLVTAENLLKGINGGDLTMTEMFPTSLQNGDVADITSPTDILDFTIAQEVLSVDFSVQGATKAVVLGVRTKDRVYNHTKASCDRLRGAEILNVKTVKIGGYNFLMQAIKQRNGVTEYAVSFAVGKNHGDSFYTLQTNWFVNEYAPSKDVFNFQVWATLPEQSTKLVNDVLNNLKASIPVLQTEVQKVPKTYAAKVTREGTELVLKLRSVAKEQSIEITMDQNYSETNGFTHRYNPLKSEMVQTIRLSVADSYEFDGLIRVEGDIQDAFYHADGNWGLDYDPTYTLINRYTVSNNFERIHEEGELEINRNVNLEVFSDDDYATLYKSLLPGQIPADYNEYTFVSFRAKGSGLLELGLIKSSVEDWKHQYRAMINVGQEEQTYYVPFKFFTSSKSTQKINADDLTMLTFTFLPVEAKTKNLDLTIQDVKFTNKAPDGYEELLYTMQNEFMIYPNPSRGNVNCLLYSDTTTTAKATLYDVSGKAIYSADVQLKEGKNELDFNFNVPTGVMFFSIKSETVNYGTSKIFFK